MKTIRALLTIWIYGMIGTFLGTSIYQWLQYNKNPELYNSSTIPWYNGIISNAKITAIVVIILWVIRYVLSTRVSKK